MLLALAMAAIAAQAPAPALQTLGGLAGCWTAPGKVRGKDATSLARGSWHLGGRYFMLQVKAISTSNPYEAALIYGEGDKPEAINAYWMDSFGGAYATAGAGAVTRDGFEVVYTYPDSVYTNRFTRQGSGWRWTILERGKDKPGERLFAEYRLNRTTCQRKQFSF